MKLKPVSEAIKGYKLISCDGGAFPASKYRLVKHPKLTRAELSALGGQAGTGKAKRRGTPEFYRRLAMKRWRKKK